jgi:restriction system protein
MMTDTKKQIWGIHAVVQEENSFLQNGIIKIGWKDMGDLSKLQTSREAFKIAHQSTYFGAKKGSTSTTVGMLYRFVHEVRIGDCVVFPSKTNRQINIGVVESEYLYEGGVGFPNQRKVRWIKSLPRTAFSQGALYEIGSALTLFSIKNYADEFLAAIDSNHKQQQSIAVNNNEDETVGTTAEDIVEATRDFILKGLSKNLKGYELENFVADLLRAMGYKTAIVSSQGGDGGIDITAYKDELPPRILVQVKSQDSDIKETTIQSLKGAMREGDYGLFVTLSNYTKNAQKYLANTPIIRGINGEELVDLILKYYELLSEKYRKMIPLKMVYIPVPNDIEE